MKQRLLWFTFGFTSAVAAVMTVFVLKDLWFDRETLSYQLKEKVDTMHIKISNLEPSVLRPNSNSTTLISLNVSVGNPASCSLIGG
ncbi:hypothetical protein RHGRI_004082 [Rhododendron griersonianum]|uniref:Uncharacterized protein n=1 Tax=Rhododendron griersonianum TaxID=479676 RepID=A0AAV6L7P2_9ERIC|nr:hypothetical protein RHGRI_004082 [Rhododendron griersonianum]